MARIVVVFCWMLVGAALSVSEEEFQALKRAVEKQEAIISSLSKKIETLQPNGVIYNWGYINVVNYPYNASGNGVTDDTSAFQTALNDAGAQGGGIVFVPTGTYLIKSHLIVPAHTILKGVADAPMRSYGTPQTPVGSTLLAVELAGSTGGQPFIFLNGDSSGIHGINIFYPNQVASNPPIPYPFAIGGSGDNLSVKNVFLANPYQGIDFASKPCGRHYIEGVYGQPLLIGIQVDQCYDIGRIKHIHFWPFWSVDQNLLNFIQANGVTFLFFRSDWEVVEDVFSWGYAVGMRFVASSSGALNGQMSNINFDQVDVGLDIQETQTWGILFSNLNLANAGGGPNHISIWGRSGGTAHVVVRGASFWGDIYRSVLWQNSGFFEMTNSLIQSQTAIKPGAPQIEIQTGRVLLSNNYFLDIMDGGVGISIGSGVDRALVTSNEMVGNKIVNNCADSLVNDNHP